jgi:hypothetical protein
LIPASRSTLRGPGKSTATAAGAIATKAVPAAVGANVIDQTFNMADNFNETEAERSRKADKATLEAEKERRQAELDPLPPDQKAGSQPT